jgi:hypothetical protein
VRQWKLGVNGPGLSPAELAQRRTAALKHGGYSDRLIRAKARGHKRRVLRSLRIKASDLDPLANEALNIYAQGRAKLDLVNAADPERSDKFYWWAYNATGRAWERFERRLRELGLDRGSREETLADVLAAYDKGAS